MNPSRILLAMVGAGILGTMVLGLRAADETNPKAGQKPEVVKEQLTLQEQMLRDQFQQFQTSILKQNADAEKAAVQTLLGTPSTANLAPGVGGNLNIAA